MPASRTRPEDTEMLSLEGLIAHHARYRGDLSAVTVDGETLSWRQFAARVNRAANLLASRGIGSGDRVATVLSNCRELLEIYWAVPTIGAVLVPLSPLLQEHKDRLNALLPGRFHELYGLTEGFVTVLDKREASRKSGSVGAPPLFYEMRIVDDDGRDVPTGEAGEIAGRGPILMTGYAGRDDLTGQAVRDGWLFTGDMGRVDEEGYLYLVDRKKDMIDSGGVKVYPKDIEEIAAHHPAIREVAVFGVPHEKWGETPLAAVTLTAPGAATADELRDWINARASARYQRLSQVVIHADFPRSAAGKTLKRELRAPFWEGRGRKI